MAQRRRRHLRSARLQGDGLLRKNWIAIINPRSGGHRAHIPEILGGLQRLTAKTVFTRYPGHAAELALRSSAYAGVAVIGGDGTLFETLQGIDRRSQRLALIPAGRGNSLARDLGLMRRQTCLDVINWDSAHHIDLLEVSVTTGDGKEARHLSASTVALGYPATVARRAGKVPWLGSASYPAVASITGPSRFRACIQYDDSAPRELCLTGFIANNTRHVANFLAFRQGNCRDGLFEIMEMDAGFSKQTMHNLSALSGRPLYEPYDPLQARRARVLLEAPQDLLVDGEFISNVLALEVRILPSAITCSGPKAG